MKFEEEWLAAQPQIPTKVFKQQMSAQSSSKKKNSKS
jgi:hypothetical protein